MKVFGFQNVNFRLDKEMLMKEAIGMYTEHRNIAVCIRDEFVQHVQQHCLRNKYSDTLKKTIQITLRDRLSFSAGHS